MKILALDTSMQACSVAIAIVREHSDRVQLLGCYEEIERGHAERLVGMIDEVLSKASLGLKQIDQLAVCRGPGTFTGVRIGLATARGLALTCNKPLVGIGTLQVLAAKALFERDDLASIRESDLGIAVDARRGEIYWQLFDKDGRSLGEPLAISPQDLAAIVQKRGKSITLAGSGAALIAEHLDRQTDYSLYAAAGLQPDAAHLAQIVADMNKQECSSHQNASPIYLRPADAKIQTGYAIERQ